MAEFRSVKEVEKFLKGVIYDALDQDIADDIKEYESAAARSVVYGAYVPTMYSRRGTLQNVEYMRHTVDGNLKLEVVNEAPFNDYPSSDNKGNELAMLVELGNGGGGYYYEHFPKYEEPTFSYPRPFIRTAFEEFSVEAVDDMKQALRNQGLTVE